MMYICLATDFNNVQMCCECIHDIIMTKNPDTEITFYVLLDSVKNSQIFDRFNELDQIKVIPIFSSSYQLITKGAKIDGIAYWLTATTYLRYIIPSLPELQDVDRILYLDTDMLALRDLSNIYNYDLHDNLIGGIKNSTYIRNSYKGKLSFVGSLIGRVINAGVLLMDLNKLREFDFTKKCIDFTRERGVDDEIVINHICKNKIQFMDPTMNIPYTFIVYKHKNMNDIDCWNAFHNTSFASLNDLVCSSYLLHFITDKKAQLNFPKLRAIHESRYQRFKKFVETGIIQKEDILPLVTF